MPAPAIIEAIVPAAVARRQKAAIKAGTTNVAAPLAPEKTTIEFSADPEFAKAQKFIEEMPDSSAGYNRLASLYIKKARENGDFSLNSKAESAVDKALEIKFDDAMARKLKASLQLTFHRFDKAL